MKLDDRSHLLQDRIVTAAQMQAIVNRLFSAGMPVAALMEKVGGLLSRRIQTLYPLPQNPQVGILVGPGHNGGDALVVARELHFQGYAVKIFIPLPRQKELTAHHAQYARSLGIVQAAELEQLRSCSLIVDGLFGIGLERSLTGELAELVDQVNSWQIPILSIDLPSGLHTDTGAALGTAIQATHTLCLGAWKLGILQEQALAFVGTTELIDFDLPLREIDAVVGDQNPQRITPSFALSHLPLARPQSTHKYKMGHLLLICGSERYAGGAILTGLGARASGVGMLSIAVPSSLKSLLTSHLPEALIMGCPETADGAIADLPDSISLEAYQAIACGPGLTRSATAVVPRVLDSDRPLLLDADGLNIVAEQGARQVLSQRQAVTVLTPHQGEFQRLFPEQLQRHSCRVEAAKQAAAESGAIVLLKGARVIVAHPQGQVWINPHSTPALARGGSGDVLTGLTGGLLAQNPAQTQAETVAVAAWWHSQAGIVAAQTRTELGVDAWSLTQFLIPALQAELCEC